MFEIILSATAWLIREAQTNRNNLKKSYSIMIIVSKKVKIVK